MERHNEQYQAKRYQRNLNDCSNEDFWIKNDSYRPKDRLITPDEVSISSLDGLSDLSFYELPSSMYQDSLRYGSKLHLSELIVSPQRVSRPPHHATAEAHHISTVIDSEHFHSSPSPLSQTVPNNTTQTQPSTQATYHQTLLPRSEPVASVYHGDKRVAFSHVLMPNGPTANPNGSNSMYIATVEKPLFGASSRANNSNRNGSVQKPGSLQNNGKMRCETPQTITRTDALMPGLCQFGNYNGPSINGKVRQEGLEAPNQTSFRFSSNGILSPRSQKSSVIGQSMKEKRTRHETVEKDQVKSVSFWDLESQSMPKVTKVKTNIGLNRAEGLVSSNRNTNPRHKQSNLSHSGKRLEELLLASRSALASEQPMKHLNGSSSEPLSYKNFHIADSSIRKPLSPPTRDTDGLCNPNSSTSDHNSAVQVLSLYEGQAIFQEHSPKTKSSKGRVLQSNTKVELQHVQFKPDNESALKLSKRKTWVPLSKPKGVSDDVCIFKHGKTSFGKNGGKEHSLDNEFEPNTWSHLSLANSFSVDTSQRISSALWAMKLIEAAHSSSPGLYQNLLLKARLFRRWLQRTRLKRVIKQEDQKKDENAIAHWQMELLHKYFNAWKMCGKTMAVSAHILYKKQMLRKGLKGLRFAVEQQRLLCSDLQSRIKGGILARYWLKWQKALKKKETQRLKIAFGRWKSTRLEQSRERILEDMADRHIMSRNYTRWKLKYQVEQKNSVASLHYKICLLTKSWHYWRVYVAEMIVKKRLKDIARLQYDEHLTACAFTVWRDNTRKSAMAGNVAGRRLAVRAFYRWKNWAQYAKIIRLRFQSMCKEYYYKSLVKATFNKWRHRLQNNRADTFRCQTQQKRILKLWYLRYRRKVIHRHLCKALAKKSKKRRFFGKWRNFTKRQQNKRERFVEKVQLLEVKHLFKRWKEHTAMKSALRSKLGSHFRRKDQQLTRKTMDKWRFAMKIVHLREHVRLNWSRRCVRLACKSWKLLLRRKRLEQRLIDVTPTLKMIIMRRTFQKWLVQKRIADEQKEKVAHVKSILEQAFKLRVLMEWRVANQESQIIAPMVARRERKVIARVFDAWRLRVSRQNHVVHHLLRARETLVAKCFCHWRNRATLIQKECNVIGNLYHSKLLRHFKAWRGFVLNRRLERLRTRAKALSLMQCYFSIWKSKVEEKHEAKDEQYASQARQRLLVSWVFNYWCQTAKKLKDFLNEQEERCIAQNKTNLLVRVFKRWLKLFRNEQKTREHIEYRRNELLRKIIRAWRKDTKETLDKEVFNFTTSLTLDSSIGSCLGSTFRSTLGSSYHSDALSTSGYVTDVRLRRGSGPVPLQYLKIDDRDDEVISLPGRFDQLRSPIVKTAPITVLREASSGQMSPQTVQPETIMFPQVIQSPSPLSSPENMPLGFSCTVPVKYEEEVVPALGLHSCSDESEEQDERASMVSSYSMTGRSVESIRDREMVLTDTILHWRRLPLSLTFRTWMKFARKRKLLRELLFYLREKKRKEVMASTLKKWRRQLFVKFTAREHWLYKTRLKCLLAWHGYAKHNQVKEERQFLADKHRRTVCLRHFLTLWRDRYNSKLLLQKFAIHWREEALVSKQHKDITEAIKHRQSSTLLRGNFLYWVEQTKTSQRAKAFYFENLVPKFFAAWYVLVRDVVTRKKKLKMFGERRLLAVSFREWRSRFIASQRVCDLLEGKETSLLLEIMRQWHIWAEGMSSRRNKAQHFRRCTELRTTKEIFAMWRDLSQQLRNFTKTYELKLIQRVLCAWQGFTVLEIQNRRKLLEFKEEKARNLVRQSFKFWRSLQIHTEHARSNLRKAEQRLVKKCFDEWRHDALKHRAHKHNVYRLQRKMFLSWYDQHIKRKTARRLISNWRSKTEEAKFMSGKALEVVQEKEKKMLRQSFDTWVLEAHKIQKAKNLAWINCMQRTFMGWYTYSHSRVLHRQILTEVEQKKKQSLLFSSFSTWNQLFRRRERNLVILDNFLEQKQKQMLKVYMARWRKDTLKCRAQTFHERRLAEKCFTEWWFRLSTMKGLETVKEKILSRKARAAAHHWRRWTVRVKKHAKQAEDLRSKLEERLLHQYFRHWVHSLQQAHRAEVHHGQAIVKRSLERWRFAAQKRQKEQRKMKEFQEHLRTKRMTKIFSSWCNALKTVTRQKVMVKTQMAKHNSRMLKHAMVRWQKIVKKARAEKHHSIVCVAKCFLEWKLKMEDKLKEKKQEQLKQEKAERFYCLKLSKLCFHRWLFDIRADKYEQLRLNRLVERAFCTWKKKCSLNVSAKELIDRHMYDKYWNLWRRQLIRKRVSELMQKHEEKKLLSEVFVEWFRLVLVRRQLLKVYKTHVTKKWFIKWMQKYNDS